VMYAVSFLQGDQGDQNSNFWEREKVCMCFIKLANSSPWSPYSSVRIAITFRSINFIRIRSFIFSFRTVLSALLLA